MSADTLPPFDEAAEAGALGCVLTANGTAEQFFDKLNPDHSYDERHRAIYTALDCLRIDRKPLNVITLLQWLKDKGQLEDAGGFDYVAALTDKTPSALMFPHFLETLEDRAARRAALRDAAELSRLANDPSIPAKVLSDAARRIGQAHNADQSLPEMSDGAAFVAQDLPEQKELVQGLFHQGSKLALGGCSKGFKTWLLLCLALAIAHGKKWLGFPTNKGRVLYINFEIQNKPMQKRIVAVARALGIEIEPGAICFWNLRGKAANFETMLPKILARAEREGFALIIFDPIYKLYGGTDENKAGDVARLMNGLEELAVETGAAIAFGAHFSKGNQAGKESIDRISGSGVFARDPDSLLIFTKHEQEDCFTVEPTLRNFAPVEPFAVRWEYPLMVPDAGLDPSKLKQAGGRKPEHLPEDLLKLLPPGGLLTKDWITAADCDGISRRTFFRLKKALEQSERVIQERVTLLWKPVNKP